MAAISVKKPHKEAKNARVELKTRTELKESYVRPRRLPVLI
ncbi:hypothetical protein Xenpb_01808 [Xenorhabdus sp. PB62.4]|nr:hypothetical protein [Xenorhabdus sp. PB62.4]